MTSRAAAAVVLVSGLFLQPCAARAETILSPVRFPGPNRNGPVLTALLSKPEGSGSFPAVVLLHGCGGMYTGSGRLNARQRQWDETLRGAGFVTLHLDSFTPRGLREVCTMKDRPITVWKDRRPDAYAALSFLRSLPFVRPDAIAVMGWSMGGLTALAAMEPDAESPEKGYSAGVALYPGCRLEGRGEPRPAGPLLLLLGEADDWTPPEKCDPVVEDARRRRETVELYRYPEAFHGFDSPGSKPRLRTGLGRAPGGSAHVGEDPAARLDALKRVPEFLLRHLSGPVAGRRNGAGDRSGRRFQDPAGVESLPARLPDQ